MPRTGKTKSYSSCVLNTDHRAPARVPQDSVMQASHSKQVPKQRRGDKNTTVKDQLVSALYQAITSMQTVKMQAGTPSVAER